MRLEFMRALAVTLCLIMSACGGGGGGSGQDPGGPPLPPDNPMPPNPPVAIAPTITQQPANQNVNDGQSASFSVAASGTDQLTYQWRRNGDAILGAVSSTYTFISSLADNAARFSVTVTNAAGAVTSAAASLQVVPVAPSIDTQPTAQTVLSGSTAMFSLAASGSQPLTYQWRKNGVVIPGAINSNYFTPTNSLVDSGALFDVIVSNVSGSVMSTAALLTVSEVVIAPTITKQPVGASAPVGASVAFSIVASGTAPFNYQWQRNGVDIPNETQATLILAPVSGINDRDRYAVAVRNAAGSVVSSAAILSVASFPGQIDLVAGLYGGPGNVDGTGANAHFRFIADVAGDTSGNLFVADNGNNTVRKVTPMGVVTTIAGSAGQEGFVDANGSNARFRSIGAIVADAAGNVFVTDGNTIRKIAPNGTVATLAGSAEESGYVDGVGTAARFDFAAINRGRLAVATNGDLYVGDCNNHVVRRVTQAGVVTTFAGTARVAGSTDGAAATASFSCPSAVALDASDNVYVADSANHTVRKITSGNVATLAGTASQFGNRLDGPAGSNAFQDMVDIAVDSTGNVFVLDSRELRKVSAAGDVSTVAGQCCSGSFDGVGVAAGLGFPEGLGIDNANNVYVADRLTSSLRKVTPTFVVTTFPSRLGQSEYEGHVDGAVADALFDSPVGVTSDTAGNIFVAEESSVRKISSGFVSTLDDARQDDAEFFRPAGITIDSDGTLYVSDQLNEAVYKVTPAGQVSLLASSASGAKFFRLTGIASDGAGNVYVADSYYYSISKIVVATGVVTNLAGNPLAAPGSVDGTGLNARFGGPCGITTDGHGVVYVADCDNHTIRKVTPAGVVTTFAGRAGAPGYIDGDISAALFNSPVDVSFDDQGNAYVADQGNGLIRKISAQGVVSTVAGVKGLEGQMLGPLPASLNAPIGIHARTLGNGRVELLVTIEHGVIRIVVDE